MRKTWKSRVHKDKGGTSEFQGQEVWHLPSPHPHRLPV